MRFNQFSYLSLPRDTILYELKKKRIRNASNIFLFVMLTGKSNPYFFKSHKIVSLGSDK